MRPTLLLHVGDWDPAGLTIYTQLYHDVKAFAYTYMRKQYKIEPQEDWYVAKRIAITPQQVDLYIDASLLGRVKGGEYNRDGEIKKDWYPGIHGNKSLTCECEALDPRILVDIVKEHIEANIDKPTRQHVLDLEAEECARLKRQISKLRVGRHGREPSLTPDLTRQVHDMRRLGMSIRHIADVLSVSKSVVARALVAG